MTAPKHQCSTRVYGRFRGSNCSKAAKIERNGKWYCGVHDPEKVAARAAKRTEEFEAGWAIRKARMKLEAAAPDLLAALKGVLAVSDRQTIEYDMARAAIAKAETETT